MQAHELRGLLNPGSDEDSEVTSIQFLVQTSSGHGSQGQQALQGQSSSSSRPSARLLPSGVLVTGLPAALMTCCRVSAHGADTAPACLPTCLCVLPGHCLGLQVCHARAPGCLRVHAARQAQAIPAELLLDTQIYQPPDAAALGQSAQSFGAFLRNAGMVRTPS